MSAAPQPAPDSEPTPRPTRPPFADPLVRLGRLADRGNLLTVGGWTLFAASTLFAAAFAGPDAATAPATPVAAADAAEPDPPSSERLTQEEQTPLESAPRTPVRVAVLPGGGGMRVWPSVPEGYRPPPLPPVPADESPAVPLPDGPPARPAFAPPAAVPPPEVADGPPADLSANPWADALSDLPPAAAADLNALREQFGPLVPPVPAVPVVPVVPPVEARPEVPDELQAALRTVRRNILGAFTRGYRRVEPGGTQTSGRVILTPGPVRETGRPLDLALTGPGWFAVVPQSEGGPQRLTRDGGFRVSGGKLGFEWDGACHVLGEGGGPIEVPPGLTGLRVGDDGRVYGTDPAGGAERVLGRVAVVAPADAAAVRPSGGRTYLAPAQVSAVSHFTARAGCVEGANVDLAAELARLDALQAAAAALRTLPTVASGDTPAAEPVLSDAFDDTVGVSR